MPQKPYELAVAYRICPLLLKQAPVYGNDKFKLSELCIRTFKESLGCLRAKIYVLLDNCPQEYEKIVRKYFQTEDLTIFRLDGIGNKGTYKMQIDILLKQDDAEVVYFAEDDYYYFSGALERMVRMITSNADVHFVSPYDHLDLYTTELHNHPNYIKVFENHHWRTANSTCLTFLTTKTTLNKARRIMESYCRGNHDASMWLILTKYKLNPFKVAVYRFTNWRTYDIVTKAWFYGWRHILFGRRMKLWIPVPSLATHMLTHYLAPAHDWGKIFAAEIAIEKPGDDPSI